MAAIKEMGHLRCSVHVKLHTKSMVPRSHLKKSEGLNWFNFMTEVQCSALHDWNELGSCLPYHKKVSECL